ncbi:hypothetical protein [Streptomyces evansiae]|uniref:hypothetical protein n=1 Tax=Streptomyces evansiae TaxID=3075535 RepID=UPI002884F618|nr:hypothetical protein [Streptomyces sp. DSM 41859]MDT0423623.1 hypothetical protein [Streptomyces sp. DSM 41859]
MGWVRGRRRSVLVLVWGGVLAVIAGAGFGIAAWQGVFAEERGDIAASDVCSNVPDRAKTAEALRSVLPKESTYSFEETLLPRKNDHFTSLCTVYGNDDKALLRLRALPRGGVPWDEWWSHALFGLKRDGLEPYQAGERAWVGSRAVVIGVPCWPAEAPGEAVRDLAVSVRASEPLDTGSGNARRVLLTLATDFARQAHMDARCDLPARLPEG